MKLMKHPILIIALISSFVLVAWTNYGQNKTPPKVTWEYKEGVNLSEHAMNALGIQGWEMLAYSVDSNGNKFTCFKRSK
jgi:hypothetical protein